MKKMFDLRGYVTEYVTADVIRVTYIGHAFVTLLIHTPATIHMSYSDSALC